MTEAIGQVLSFGVGGPLTELLGDRSFLIPPLADHDAQDMVREIKASPLLFGYRGSEIVDVEQIERLVRQVAELQHDLPQVRALQLPLVLAGADGTTVLGANVRVEPVKDPRSDWFVRRLSTMPELANAVSVSGKTSFPAFPATLPESLSRTTKSTP